MTAKKEVTIKQIGLVYNSKIVESKNLADFIKSKVSFDSWICSSIELEKNTNLFQNTDLVIVFGGDGTILRVAQYTSLHTYGLSDVQKSIPILGINMGRVGFMTEIQIGKMSDKSILSTINSYIDTMRLADLVQFEDQRSMLQININGGSVKDNVLNDIVVTRHTNASLVELSVSINKVHLGIYRSDGLIVSTATGSTGYSMSAGSPAIHPQLKDFLLQPLVPHMSSNSAIVVPQDASIEIETSNQKLLVSLDGFRNKILKPHSKININSSALITTFLRKSNQFYLRIGEFLGLPNSSEEFPNSQSKTSN
jgi:NAD+ kinase